jgi:hypothetical protein
VALKAFSRIAAPDRRQVQMVKEMLETETTNARAAMASENFTS